MESNDFDENIVKKQSRKIIKYIYCIGAILIIIFIFKIFRGSENVKHVTSVAFFVRTVNGLMGFISIISCLILYKKTKDQILYILLLVYVGLAIAVISGQLDYNTFLNYKFNVSNYISMTTSLLRIILLFSAVMPNSKIYKFINKYKVESFVFVTVYSLIAWKIEKSFCVGGVFSSRSLLFIFNIFICIAYSLVAIKLLLICIKKK